MNDISDAELEEFIEGILGAMNVMARELEQAAAVLFAAVSVTSQPETEYIRVPVLAMTRFGERCDAFAITAGAKIAEAGKKLGISV